MLDAGLSLLAGANDSCDAHPAARLGVWSAEGNEPTRILASEEALRLLDIEGPSSGLVSTALLERFRFQELEQIHRAACRRVRCRIFEHRMRIGLRCGGERLLLARVLPIHGCHESRSLGILLDVTGRDVK